MTKRKDIPTRKLTNREAEEWFRAHDGDSADARYSLGGEVEQSFGGRLCVNLDAEDMWPPILIVGSKDGFGTEPLFEPALTVSLAGKTEIYLEERGDGVYGNLLLTRGTHYLELEVGPFDP